MTEWLHFHFSLSCIGEGNGNPLQCSCLENPRDGGAWWAAIYGVAQSRTRLKWLSSSSSSSSYRASSWALFNIPSLGNHIHSQRYKYHPHPDNPQIYNISPSLHHIIKATLSKNWFLDLYPKPVPSLDFSVCSTLRLLSSDNCFNSRDLLVPVYNPSPNSQTHSRCSSHFYCHYPIPSHHCLSPGPSLL